MSILIKINDVDKTDEIIWDSLVVIQNLTSQVDTCSFKYRKYGSKTIDIDYNDDVKVFDGATQIFGGIAQKIIQRTETGADGFVYDIACSDYTVVFDRTMASKTYESMTIKEIITDICSSFAPTFNADNVTSDFEIAKIVFNQVKPSLCLKKLADIVKFDWYIDENKSVHFFGKYQNLAPFDLTDTNGNYVYKTLERTTDGSQVVNRVKVRGGDYNGSLFTDSITVSGDASKSFNLPYQFDNLVVKLNTVVQTVLPDNLNDFTSADVLWDYQNKTIRWENVLSDADVIEFSGNPKVRVFVVSEDSDSIALYGKIEKLIREDDIRDNAVARKRALGELYAYAETVTDAVFETRTAGLRTGMVINLTSVRRACDDDFIINTITFRPIDTDTFGYRVQCVSGKRYGLLEILAKLLEPEIMDADDTEVSEEIYSDTASLTILEEHDVVVPVEDNAILTIVENHIIIASEPEWVLAEYTPTSQTDPKRQGRLDYSLKVY